MFNTGLIDFLLLCPIVLSLIFGFVVHKTEESKRINPLFSKVFGFSLLTFIFGFGLYFKFVFSKMSIIVLQGLFKIDHFSAVSGLILTLVCMLIYLGSFHEKRLGLKSSELFNFLGLILALNFSNNLILIFVFSELIFIKAALARNPLRGVFSFQGTRVRIVGLILLLGSIAANFGADNSATVDFFKSNAQTLFTADYLFLIGVLFTLSGLVEIFYSLFRTKVKSFDFLSFFVGFGLLITIYKYSSAQMFAVLNDLQVLIQWVCVLSLIFTALKSLSSKTFKGSIKYLFLNSLIMSVVFTLSFMFDGRGSSGIGLLYLFTACSGLLLLLFVEERLKALKGDSLLMTELKGLSFQFPKRSCILVLGAFLALSFPLGAGFLVLSSGFKVTLQTGFYWVGFWALFSTALIWSYNYKLMELMFFKSQEDQALLLWRSAEIEDIKTYQAFLLTLGLILLPILSLCFLSL